MNEPKQKLMIKSNELYDILKYIAQIVLPALGTLYFALSEIWGLSYGVEVVGTIAAFDAFLGVLLRISTNQYDKSDARFSGTINVYEDERTKTFSLDMNEDPYDLEKKDQVMFRVNRADYDS